MVDSKKQWKAWLYLSPAIILLLIFTVWPIINTIRVSFVVDYNQLAAIGGTKFIIGFDNYINIVKYPGFRNCLVNTLVLCFLTVPLSTMIALIIAACLNSIKPLSRLFQTIYFLPYVTNSIAIGMVFAAMFSMVGSFIGTDHAVIQTYGIVNTVIQFFGGKPINWVNDNAADTFMTKLPNYMVLVIYIVWNALPFKILILLGGLQSVNKQYYDAAKVDGTSRFRVFWRITVPLLSPMIAYVVITGFIGGFKEYSSVVGIFGETMGPVGTNFRTNMNTMVGLIYDNISGNQGRASAAALILFLIIFAVTLVNLYVSKKRVHY